MRFRVIILINIQILKPVETASPYNLLNLLIIFLIKRSPHKRRQFAHMWLWIATKILVLDEHHLVGGCLALFPVLQHVLVEWAVRHHATAEAFDGSLYWRWS
ncbi:hypothetical protein LINPERHAP2_LOCUS23694 [Linum perenne]